MKFRLSEAIEHAGVTGRIESSSGNDGRQHDLGFGIVTITCAMAAPHFQHVIRQLPDVV
jgi:hypothetical protein